METGTECLEIEDVPEKGMQANEFLKKGVKKLCVQRFDIFLHTFAWKNLALNLFIPIHRLGFTGSLNIRHFCRSNNYQNMTTCIESYKLTASRSCSSKATPFFFSVSTRVRSTFNWDSRCIWNRIQRKANGSNVHLKQKSMLEVVPYLFILISRVKLKPKTVTTRHPLDLNLIVSIIKFTGFWTANLLRVMN